MKQYLILYKPFLFFLTKFFVSYLVLTILYQYYQNQYNKQLFQTDGFTVSVAHQTASLMLLFNNTVHTEPSTIEPCMNFYYNYEFVSRIVEGCNAMSIMILFVAFVIAFTGTIKHTILYCLFGCVLIHVMNIIRIALINAAAFHYKQYNNFLHDIIFPLFIYGVVFILWVVWVNKFSKFAKENV